MGVHQELTARTARQPGPGCPSHDFPKCTSKNLVVPKALGLLQNRACSEFSISNPSITSCFRLAIFLLPTIERSQYDRRPDLCLRVCVATAESLLWRCFLFGSFFFSAAHVAFYAKLLLLWQSFLRSVVPLEQFFYQGKVADSFRLLFAVHFGRIGPSLASW